MLGASLNDQQSMQRASFLLEPPFFHTVSVKLGTILAMKQRIVHHGVNNRYLPPRIILFDILSTSKEKGQDEHQFYDWMWKYEAYGVDSPQFAQSLLQYKDTVPSIMSRYDDNSQTVVKAGIDTIIARLKQVKEGEVTTEMKQ